LQDTYDNAAALTKVWRILEVAGRIRSVMAPVIDAISPNEARFRADVGGAQAVSEIDVAPNDIADAPGCDLGLARAAGALME